MYDMLGFFEKVPRFAKKYADAHTYILDALKTYVKECEEHIFPAQEHCYFMKEGEPEKLLEMLAKEEI